MDDRNEIIDRIIEIELEMFQLVNAQYRNCQGGCQTQYQQQSSCQDKPETFKLMRWMSHSPLSLETLKLYLSDLEKAINEGRNLMTEKYGLMDDLFPHPDHDSEMMNDIIENEIKWMNELRKKYPNLIQDNGDDFRNYMVCEYETYSEETLQSLRNDILKAKRLNKNLPELRYKNLFKRLGYDSLEEAQKKM